MERVTESARVILLMNYTYCQFILYLDARRPPIEEIISANDLQDVDPLLLGRQGYRLWYLKCRHCGGRAVCKELDDGTRLEFRITVPHRCDTDEISNQIKRIESTIIEEASDPAAILSLRSIHERHTENLHAEVRAIVKTVLQMRSMVSRRRKARLPEIPGNLRDIQIPAYYSNIHRNGGELFFQGKLNVAGGGQRDETILLFATEKFMRTLFNKDLVSADGGFKHAPRRFKQVSISYNSGGLIICL